MGDLILQFIFNILKRFQLCSMSRKNQVNATCNLRGKMTAHYCYMSFKREFRLTVFGGVKVNAFYDV